MILISIVFTKLGKQKRDNLGERSCKGLKLTVRISKKLRELS